MLTSARSPEMETLKARLKNMWMADDCGLSESDGRSSVNRPYEEPAGSRSPTNHQIIKEAVMYDIQNLGRMKNLAVHAPNAMQAFVAFDKAVLAEGAIPRKYKELMAIAVALTTQCPYCIDLHTDKARETGASDSEIAETVLIAAALRAGGAITHGTHAMKGT
jgi:AhpD family alkylhydroperoxidase